VKGFIGPHEEVAAVNTVSRATKEVSTAIGIVLSCTNQLGWAVVAVAADGYIGAVAQAEVAT
jgi:hypothetical protein